MVNICTGMRVLLTQNRDKSHGIVNDQVAMVNQMHNATIFLQLPNSKIVFVHPVTQYDTNGERVTVYPFVPAYALTVCKAQGHTLDYIVLWFDFSNPTTWNSICCLIKSKKTKFFVILDQSVFLTICFCASNRCCISVTHSSSAQIFTSLADGKHTSMIQRISIQTCNIWQQKSRRNWCQFLSPFPRNLFRPYGIAYNFPKPVVAFKFLKPFTCEWLKRSDYGMSEMSDSITANFDILAESDCRVLRNGKVINLLETNKQATLVQYGPFESHE